MREAGREQEWGMQVKGRRKEGRGKEEDPIGSELIVQGIKYVKKLTPRDLKKILRIVIFLCHHTM